MISHQIVIGYHGCDALTADKVVKDGEHLKISENDYDWLGHGVYFWEDNLLRAKKWAVEQSKRTNGRIKTPAVIGAVINLGNCLNLVDDEAIGFVAEAYKAYINACSISERKPAENTGKYFNLRNLDCAVFQTLHALRKEAGLSHYDTVRGFFVEGKELYAGAGIRSHDHVQLCVRSTAQILGYFFPKG